MLSDYTTRSAGYLARAGLRVITVWNGPTLSGAQATSYATNMPHLLGVTDQSGTAGLRVIDSKLPQLSLAAPYAATEAALEAGIDAQLAGWNKSAPLFVGVQGNLNQAAINPTTFLAVQTHYAANTDVLFVRADHLFTLIRPRLPTILTVARYACPGALPAIVSIRGRIACLAMVMAELPGGRAAAASASAIKPPPPP
jgi:hypothetical protein